DGYLRQTTTSSGNTIMTKAPLARASLCLCAVAAWAAPATAAATPQPPNVGFYRVVDVITDVDSSSLAACQAIKIFKFTITYLTNMAFRGTFLYPGPLTSGAETIFESEANHVLGYWRDFASGPPFVSGAPFLAVISWPTTPLAGSTSWAGNLKLTLRS